MSIQYCHDCGTYIDTDYDAEHFPCDEEERELMEAKDYLSQSYKAGIIELEEYENLPDKELVALAKKMGDEGDSYNE